MAKNLSDKEMPDFGPKAKLSLVTEGGRCVLLINDKKPDFVVTHLELSLDANTMIPVVKLTVPFSAADFSFDGAIVEILVSAGISWEEWAEARQREMYEMAKLTNTGERTLGAMRPEGEQRKGLKEMMKRAVQFNGGQKIGTIVEIGSCRGESTEILAEHARLVIAVDPWEDFNDAQGRVVGMVEVERDFDLRMVQLIDGGRVKKMKMTSMQASQHLKNMKIDMVYIDGNHDGVSVTADIKAWRSKIRAKGLIAGHDYRGSRTGKYDGLMKAVDTLVGAVERFDDSSWLAQL